MKGKSKKYDIEKYISKLSKTKVYNWSITEAKMSSPWTKAQAIEISSIKSSIKENTKGIKENSIGIKENAKGIKENAKGIKENSIGIKENAKGIKENAKGIKKNSEGINKIIEILARNGMK